MRNIKNEIIYYWRILKAEVKGGYEATKNLIDIDQFKENMQYLKEDKEFKRQQKDYRRKRILREGDIVTFYDPDCLGNIITIEVERLRPDDIYEEINVTGKVIDTCLKNGYEKMMVTQHDILNNLVKLEKAEN